MQTHTSMYRNYVHNVNKKMSAENVNNPENYTEWSQFQKVKVRRDEAHQKLLYFYQYPSLIYCSGVYNL